MQPRAIGRRVSDEFAVPLCRTHHRAVHRSGDEVAWWKAAGIDPAEVAHRLWQHTRLNGAPIQEYIDPLLGVPSAQGLAGLLTNDVVAAVQANQMNALKSSGPRTEEGNRASMKQQGIASE
jgi:hypothetical protein